MKTLVITHQKLVKKTWEPQGAKFFEISDKVNVADLTAFFNVVQYSKGSRLTVSARATRDSPQLTPHIEDLFTEMNDFQSGVRRSMSNFREPGKQKAIMDEAQTKFREWCERVGLRLDWTPKE